MKLGWYLEIVPKLGIWNVLYILLYRLRLRSAYPLRRNPIGEVTDSGSLFGGCPMDMEFPGEWKDELLRQADRILEGELPYFSHHWIKQSDPPNWFINPFNGKESKDYNKHWSKISDFNQNLGDIKCLWEASRFTWLGILARAYVVSGKEVFLQTLNRWLDDWISKNPVNQGPNWKCGQEASFRVLALLNAAHILDQANAPSEKLMELISLHLKRISSNIRYAKAQRNNHASSEAAALYIGGNWLLMVNALGSKQNRRFAEVGRKALESLVGSLTYEDGSFSQHSVVYHRLFLDTLTFIMFWTGKMDLPRFTPGFYEKAKKAYSWMYALVDESGDCPNLGPNDGTLLQSNHSCDYRDFRPSLQLASVLLKDLRIFQEGPYNEALYWFGYKQQNEEVEAYTKPVIVYKSGYVVMKGQGSWALLRFPYFKFRPSHNDALHFDLWADGKNLLFDSGSYSYNPDSSSKVPDLKSVHAHNTLSFDRREQMPRLGRFLLAKWLKPLSVGDLIQSSDGLGAWEGSYKDAVGNFHLRRITWNDRHWEIVDRFSGGAAYVELGFNFDECSYSLDQDASVLMLPWGKIAISKSTELSVRSHRISHYYFKSQVSNRLIISSENNSELTTTIDIF